MTTKKPLSASNAFKRASAKSSIIASLTAANLDQLKKKSKYGRTPRSTLDKRGEDGSLIDPEHELHRQLYEPMRECSRQRLRSLQMGLRKYANIDSRITVKELQQVFQDINLKLPNRLIYKMAETFEDNLGVDIERLYRSLVELQTKSGRDSVMAQNTKNDVENQKVMSQEEKDADLVRRLEKVLTKAGGKKNKYDLTPIRNSFQSRDKNKTGLLKKSEIEMICTQLNVPVYGALLNGLLNRCDDEGLGDVSWPEVMSFLEKAQLNLDNAQNQDKMSILSGRPMSVLSLDSSTSSGSNSSKTSNKKGAKGRGGFRGRAGQKGNKQQQGKDKQNKSENKGGKKANIIEEHPDEDEDEDDEDDDSKKTAEQEPTAPKGPMIQITRAPNTPGSGASASPKVDVKSPRSPRGRPVLKAIDMDVKGKKLTFYPPDNYNDNTVNTDPPQLRLKLEWVYGYRGNDCRSNIYVLNSGEIIYFIGTVVVMYTRETHKQRHYKEHTQEIRCLALHHNGITVATGQGAYVPQNSGAHIRIWRADTLQTQHVIGTDFFTKNVLTLAFSKSKERLLAVDMASGHNLSVWDTGTGKLLAQTNLKVEVMCDAGFQPTNPDVVVTIGKEHLAWWSIYPEQQAITMQCKADYDNFLRPKYVICMLHNERGDLVTGDSNGTIYVWGNGGNTITNFIKHGHEGPVFSLTFNRNCLLTSGRDGKVNSWIWSKNMDKSGELKIPKQEGGVRMIQVHKDHLLIGTTTNSILTAELSPTALRSPLAGVELNEVPLTQGHFDVLAGLSIVRSSEHNSQILTAGTDGIVCMFDCQKKQPLWKYMLKSTSAVCVDVSVAGTLIAMGTRDSVLVLQVDQHDEEDEEEGLYLQQICHHKVTTDRLTTIKLNNDCTVIAAGDTGGAIHLVKWKQDESGQFLWELTGTLTGHSGAITSIDWSSEKVAKEFVLRSTSSDTQLFFWDVAKQKKLDKPENVRNVAWLTEHCLLNYSVAGVWHSKQAKDGEVCTVDVNQRNKLVAMGNSRGYVSLFRYPCSKPGMYSHTYRAHPIVYNLSFTRDGRKLLSVGGPDSCIMQWHVL